MDPFRPHMLSTSLQLLNLYCLMGSSKKDRPGFIASMSPTLAQT